MNKIQQELNEQLFDAVKNGTVEQIKQLIAGGANVKAKKVMGPRLLYILLLKMAKKG